jgi:uncharacterized membrane-anchored protein
MSENIGNIFLMVFIIGGGIALFLCYRYIWFTTKKKHRSTIGWILISLLMPFFLAPIIALILSKLKPLPKSVKDYQREALK